MTSKDALSYHQQMKLQEIFDLYEERLRLVENAIRDLFLSRAPSIQLIGNYLISSGGKRLRPLFHLVSADLASYPGSSHIEIAAIIESIHTASLLHDDVIDSASMRRGQPTANSVWGNQAVVLVGDFLYSNALKSAVMLKNQRIMETLSAATTRMTEGELLQLNRIGDLNITEEECLEIISAKTGALISAACRIGAILGGLPEHEETALANFGMKTGIVFQMADDILDYMADRSELGKIIGKDLEEGKITLPLLHLLTAADQNEKTEVQQIIRSDLEEKGITRILDLLRKYNSIDAAFSRARLLIDEAKAELAVFADSQPKQTLLAIADYSLYRGR